MPPRAPVEAVEFVEFAARGVEADQLESLFATLGFRAEGKHRTRDVTVWRQGAARLVMNRSRGDFAGSAYATHGAAVCDIGLRVADAAAVADRAAALGSVAYDQRRSAGEVPIPAFRGPGGELLHVLDPGLTPVWGIEFTPLPGDDTGVGITGFDHIAQTVGYEAMARSALFYQALFPLKRAPQVDVIDPDGLVRSLALSDAAGGLRITLNGAETRRTLAGNFLAESFGASVQHLALATRDLLATADALARRGFQALPMGANYYDDLAARFDLDPAFLARLRAANALYDEENGARFLQLYGRPQGSGLFFEIVERAPGYSGFGAPNAPYRIAAQKRLLRNAAVPRA